MYYMIKAWIPVKTEKSQIYSNIGNAEEELGQLEDMQPENKYEIIECDSEGIEI